MAKPDDKTAMADVPPEVVEALAKRDANQPAKASENAKTQFAQAPATPAKAGPNAKTQFAEAPKVDPTAAKTQYGQVTPKVGGVAAGPPPEAPPRPSGPGSTPLSAQATMMLEAPQISRAPAKTQAPAPYVPTLMRERPQESLPPMVNPRREVPWGRWLLGPMISAIVAVATVALANRIVPPKTIGARPAKPQGHIRLQTDPPNAQVTVDGAPFPHFTPTVIDAPVGATVHIGFKLDGYVSKQADVYVSEGEHPFSAKLDRIEAPPPEPAPEPAPAPVKSRPKPLRPVVAVPKLPPLPAPEPVMVGTAKLSVYVRPWAIVFVDGIKLRQTPVDSYELSAGRHTVELVNDGKAKREKVLLNMKNGEVQEIRRNWD